MPDRIKFAGNLMLAGAAVRVLSGLMLVGAVSSAYGQTSIDGTFIGAGLWIWMYFAIRRGHNWARKTGTLGVLVDLAILANPTTNVPVRPCELGRRPVRGHHHLATNQR